MTGRSSSSWSDALRLEAVMRPRSYLHCERRISETTPPHPPNFSRLVARHPADHDRVHGGGSDRGLHLSVPWAQPRQRESSRGAARSRRRFEGGRRSALRRARGNGFHHGRWWRGERRRRSDFWRILDSRPGNAAGARHHLPTPRLLLRLRRWQATLRLPLPRVGVRTRWKGSPRTGHQPAVSSDLAAGTRPERDRRRRPDRRQLTARFLGRRCNKHSYLARSCNTGTRRTKASATCSYLASLESPRSIVTRTVCFAGCTIPKHCSPAFRGAA